MAFFMPGNLTVGQFGFLTYCVTKQKIQTDAYPEPSYGRERNSFKSIWKWWTPFSRFTEYRPRSYVEERKPFWTFSQRPMSSCCTSSLKATARWMRSCVLACLTSWKNHSKIVSVFSWDSGTITLVEMLSG